MNEDNSSASTASSAGGVKKFFQRLSQVSKSNLEYVDAILILSSFADLPIVT